MLFVKQLELDVFDFDKRSIFDFASSLDMFELGSIPFFAYSRTKATVTYLYAAYVGCVSNDLRLAMKVCSRINLLFFGAIYLCRC
jgi:hypothetical protein